MCNNLGMVFRESEMRSRLLALVDVCRRLKLRVKPTDDNPYAVIVGCERQHFPRHLFDLATVLKDLEEVDTQSERLDHPALTEARMKMALDATFAWMRAKGMEFADARAMADFILSPSEGQKMSREAEKALRDVVSQRGNLERAMGAAAARPFRRS